MMGPYDILLGTELAREWGGALPERLEEWPEFCEAAKGQY
jgi:hypothetical protein